MFLPPARDECLGKIRGCWIHLCPQQLWIKQVFCILHFVYLCICICPQQLWVKQAFCAHDIFYAHDIFCVYIIPDIVYLEIRIQFICSPPPLWILQAVIYHDRLHHHFVKTVYSA